MEKVKHRANGLSLHYYTDIWDSETRSKKSASEFTPQQYEQTLAQAYRIDDIVTRHIEVMNRHDCEKRVDLIVDEWGTWYEVEPGTNPGFLYQQNTMRDAMVAALTLNIFNKHSDRIRMANIAQTVNVLQAVVLTDGERMLLTPTYHVFRMFKEHQNNTLLGSYITTPVQDVPCAKSPSDRKSRPLPQLIESASIDENGTIWATVVNTSCEKPAQIKCQIADTAVQSVKAQILTGEITQHNTFDAPQNVKTTDFADYTVTADGFTAELPPCSVVRFEIR